MGKKIGNFVVQHIFAALWYALFSVVQSLMLVMALFYLVLDDTEWGKTFIQGLSNDVLQGKGIDPVIFINATLFLFACGMLMLRIISIIPKSLKKLILSLKNKDIETLKMKDKGKFKKKNGKKGKKMKEEKIGVKIIIILIIITTTII